MIVSTHVSYLTNVKQQSTALIATSSSEISLNYLGVQIQSGTYDCGLFSFLLEEVWGQDKMFGRMAEIFREGPNYLSAPFFFTQLVS